MTTQLLKKNISNLLNLKANHQFFQLENLMLTVTKLVLDIVQTVLSAPDVIPSFSF